MCGGVPVGARQAGDLIDSGQELLGDQVDPGFGVRAPVAVRGDHMRREGEPAEQFGPHGGPGEQGGHPFVRAGVTVGEDGIDLGEAGDPLDIAAGHEPDRRTVRRWFGRPPGLPVEEDDPVPVVDRVDHTAVTDEDHAVGAGTRRPQDPLDLGEARHRIRRPAGVAFQKLFRGGRDRRRGMNLTCGEHQIDGDRGDQVVGGIPVRVDLPQPLLVPPGLLRGDRQRGPGVRHDLAVRGQAENLGGDRGYVLIDRGA
nr:hypothetical protein Ade03nite_66550 [Actinoplanes derwentensis]